MRLPGRYILVDGVPVVEPDVLVWAAWFEKATNRRLARTVLNADVYVSTIFLGLDHNYSPEVPPLLWETLVFGGALDGQMLRTSTREEALQAHQEMCAVAEAALCAERTAT